ncbi:MAG TPA: hypothetical protein VEH57_02385, partial [Thermoplasmata archaeon]|nr:hypothetical protein [Thermoplasmata archaeon]
TALNMTQVFVNDATYTLNSTESVLLWNLVQDVYNNLQLTIGTTAGNVVFNYAPWVNPASINTNVLVGGGVEWYYQGLTGNGVF